MPAHINERAALGGAAGEHFTRVAAPQLERPRHTVATFRMCILHAACDVQRSAHRTAPCDDRCKLRRRMRCHAVRLHRAGGAHRGVGGVGDHAQSVLSRPAPDELVVRRALHLFLEQRPEFRTS